MFRNYTQEKVPSEALYREVRARLLILGLGFQSLCEKTGVETMSGRYAVRGIRKGPKYQQYMIDIIKTLEKMEDGA